MLKKPSNRVLSVFCITLLASLLFNPQTPIQESGLLPLVHAATGGNVVLATERGATWETVYLVGGKAKVYFKELPEFIEDSNGNYINGLVEERSEGLFLNSRMPILLNKTDCHVSIFDKESKSNIDDKFYFKTQVGKLDKSNQKTWTDLSVNNATCITDYSINSTGIFLTSIQNDGYFEFRNTYALFENQQGVETFTDMEVINFYDKNNLADKQKSGIFPEEGDSFRILKIIESEQNSVSVDRTDFFIENSNILLGKDDKKPIEQARPDELSVVDPIIKLDKKNKNELKFDLNLAKNDLSEINVLGNGNSTNIEVVFNSEGIVLQKNQVKTIDPTVSYSTAGTYDFTVPNGVSSLTIKAWGAGAATTGGFAQGTISVSAGQVYKVKVGAYNGGASPGASGFGPPGANGADLSGVFITSVSQGNAKIIGGGSGGAGGTGDGGGSTGGAGGATTGGSGTKAGDAGSQIGGSGGSGGTQAAGGTGGAGGSGTTASGTTGSSGSGMSGGGGGAGGSNANGRAQGGGGGGNGYYGGGGGGGGGWYYSNPSTYGYAGGGGGGGGSNYVISGATNTQNLQNCNTGDSDYVSGRCVAGGAGLVVLSYTLPTIYTLQNLHKDKSNNTITTGRMILSNSTYSTTSQVNASGYSTFTGLGGSYNLTAIYDNNIIANKTLNISMSSSTTNTVTLNIFPVDCSSSGTGIDLIVLVNDTDGHYITTFTTPSCSASNVVTFNIRETALGRSGASFTSFAKFLIQNTTAFGKNATSFLQNSTSISTVYSNGNITSNPITIGTGLQTKHYAYTLTLDGTPQEPTDFSCSSAGSTSVSCTWTLPTAGVTGITDHEIFYKQSNQTNYANSTLTNSTSGSGTISNLSPNVSYDFLVASINTLGAGTNSSSSSATPTSVTQSGGGNSGGGSSSSIPSGLLQMSIIPNSYYAAVGQRIEGALIIGWNLPGNLRIQSITAQEHQPWIIFTDPLPLELQEKSGLKEGTANFVIQLPNIVCQSDFQVSDACIQKKLYQIPVKITGNVGGETTVLTTSISLDLRGAGDVGTIMIVGGSLFTVAAIITAQKGYKINLASKLGKNVKIVKRLKTIESSARIIRKDERRFLNFGKSKETNFIGRLKSLK